MLIHKIQSRLQEIPPFNQVIIGVSGGADSVALAHILIKQGYNVTIAHLNHGLRGKESDADEKFVKKLAEKWKVPYTTHKIQLSDKGNLENQARLLRYAFLEKIRQEKNAKFIAVGHHLDDQIETILMHMQRGSGLRGLCGIKLRNDKIIRPLLDVRKQELIDYLKKEGIEYRTDESNFNTKLRRNLLRHKIIPELRKKDRHFEKKLLELSAAAQKQLAAVEKQARHWMGANIKNQSFKRMEFLNLSDNVQSEILFLLCGHQNIYRPSIQKIKELIQKGMTGKQKTIGRYTFQMQYGQVVFCKGFWDPSPLPKIQLTTREIRWGKWKLRHKGSEILYKLFFQSLDYIQFEMLMLF